jgi:hypothetical protein
MDFILKEESIYKGFKLSKIEFGENSFTIVYTTDYYDSDGYWEEYYTVNENCFGKILEKLEKYYTPFVIDNLNNESKIIYNSISNKNSKKIFLYILPIKIGMNIHGDELIKILCGNEIEYKKTIYSKGP